jgi:hypothetical protein
MVHNQALMFVPDWYLSRFAKALNKFPGKDPEPFLCHG